MRVSQQPDGDAAETTDNEQEPVDSSEHGIDDAVTKPDNDPVDEGPALEFQSLEFLRRMSESPDELNGKKVIVRGFFTADSAERARILTPLVSTTPLKALNFVNFAKPIDHESWVDNQEVTISGVAGLFRGCPAITNAVIVEKGPLASEIAYDVKQILEAFRKDPDYERLRFSGMIQLRGLVLNITSLVSYKVYLDIGGGEVVELTTIGEDDDAMLQNCHRGATATFSCKVSPQVTNGKHFISITEPVFVDEERSTEYGKDESQVEKLTADALAKQIATEEDEKAFKASLEFASYPLPGLKGISTIMIRKPLIVTGIVKSVSQRDDGTHGTINLDASTAGVKTNRFSCECIPNEVISSVKEGDTVSIIGNFDRCHSDYAMLKTCRIWKSSASEE